LVSLTNNTLGWKGLPGKNTPAYYEHSKVTEEKSFVILSPGVNVKKLFTFVTVGEIKYGITVVQGLQA